MMNDEPLMKANDVAKLLGVARSTVFDWARRGVIPSVVLHRGERRAVRRWRPDELREFMAQGFETNGGEPVA